MTESEVSKTRQRGPDQARRRKTYLMNQPPQPDADRFFRLVRRVLETSWWSNFGELHQEFERALQDYLGCPHVLPVANATFGLMAVLKALDVRGEVITTPLTFPATPHVLFNEAGIVPVFVDVDPGDFCLDPGAVKRAVTPATSAILAVHAYGYPCKVTELERIASDHGLKLIYDAAPAFGVRCQGRSIAAFGDASVFSFHATKVFSTGEGGAIACRSRELYDWCRRFINFGITGEDSIVLPGLNGKMDEFRAALGLAGLERIDAVIGRRREVVSHYLDFFRETRFETITVPHHLYDRPGIDLNFSYLPVVIREHRGLSRDRLYRKLREANIIVRKYYYPTILDLPTYDAQDKRIEPVAHARALASSVLCLPVNPHFDRDDCRFVTGRFEHCVRSLEAS
jgi:dTDP-4-amino-4,6-dideoxygalactose transaminase